MSRLYERLTSRYDKDLVDAILAVSAKKGGIPETKFIAEVFCRTVERACTPEYRAEIESLIAYHDSLPIGKQAKLEALKEALKKA